MQVFLTKEAQRGYFHASKIDQKKIKKRLLSLAVDPLAGKKLTGKLSGLRSSKAWPYRILYQVNNLKKEVWVVSILHRQGAYK